MNPHDRLLQRLLHAAARAPRRPTGTPPSSLAARVLAPWRSGAGDDGWAVLPRLFRQAMVCAGCITIVCIGWSWLQHRNENAGAPALARYAMSLQWSP